MQLTVLGGAAAWPNPGQGCSSYLVSDAETRLVLDCGPDTLHVLRRVTEYRDVSAIVISHCHSDHMLDLVPYRYGLVYGPQPPARRIPLWMPPGGKRVLERLADALNAGEPTPSFWDTAFDVREYDPSTSLEIGNLRLSFQQTQHYILCFACRLAGSGGRTLFYSADAGRVEPLIPLAHGCNVALVEATVDCHPDIPLESRGHITPDEAGSLAKLSGAEMLVLTHLWSERQERDVIAEARAQFDGPIAIAKPGMVVDV
ncbi:MAG: MBL fold metallo-hydrolase [Chloroflexi bacterium]|nr:MAG: MBL fold metallo-hydrolase [Chloroflexota bacterium]